MTEPLTVSPARTGAAVAPPIHPDARARGAIRRGDDARPGCPRAHRALDVVLAAVLLVLAAPLLAAAAIAIRLDSPGPVIFRQARVGLARRPFGMLKLRTMAAGADSGPHEAHVRRLLRRGGPRRAWAPLPADPRVTRVGRLLRRSAIDELPQLVNVLRGEMRLVGPRPALPYEVEGWQDWHFARLAVPPGITGLWQVSGWSRVDFDGMVRQDLDYVARRSLALDLAILARTPVAVLHRARRGA